MPAVNLQTHILTENILPSDDSLEDRVMQFIFSCERPLDLLEQVEDKDLLTAGLKVIDLTQLEDSALAQFISLAKPLVEKERPIQEDYQEAKPLLKDQTANFINLFNKTKKGQKNWHDVILASLQAFLVAPLLLLWKEKLPKFMAYCVRFLAFCFYCALHFNDGGHAGILSMHLATAKKALPNEIEMHRLVSVNK